MGESVLKFLNYLKYELKVSNNTYIAYNTDLKQYYDFMNKIHNISNLLESNFQLIRSWIISLMEQKNSTYTINRKISVLQSYYKFCIKNNYIEVNPTSKLIRPKTAKRLPKSIEASKITELFDILNDSNPKDKWKSLRDLCMFTTFYLTGIRRSELINLTWLNIDYFKMEIIVLGKGNKQRIIPISQELIDLIDNYKNILIQNDILHPQYVFITDSYNKLYDNFVYRTIKNYLSLVSSKSGIGPHSLRHSFATHLLDNGAQLNAIKELLGHSSLVATQIYTNNSIEKIKKIYKNFHPKS